MKKSILILLSLFILSSCWWKSDLDRVNDLNIISTILNLSYDAAWKYPDTLNDIHREVFRQTNSIFYMWTDNKYANPYWISELPKDDKAWKDINWCTFWYTYTVFDVDWINNGWFELLTCLEKPEKIPWSMNWKYVVKGNWF